MLPLSVSLLCQQVYKTEEKTPAKKNYSFLDLVRTPTMRKQSLIVFYLWWVRAALWFQGFVCSNLVLPTHDSSSSSSRLWPPPILLFWCVSICRDTFWHLLMKWEVETCSIRSLSPLTLSPLRGAAQVWRAELSLFYSLSIKVLNFVHLSNMQAFRPWGFWLLFLFFFSFPPAVESEQGKHKWNRLH